MKKLLPIVLLLGLAAQADVVHLSLQGHLNPHLARLTQKVLKARLTAWYLGAPAQPKVVVQGAAVTVDLPTKPALAPPSVLTSPGRVSLRLNQGSHDKPQWSVLALETGVTPWFSSGRYLGMKMMTLQFSPAGAKAMARASTQAMHRELGLFVDDTLVVAAPVETPVVTTKIPLQLACPRTMKDADARALASLLVGGPLPVAAKVQ